MPIDNKSAQVKNLFKAIKRGELDDVRLLVQESPLLLHHARTGPSETDTPLLIAVMAGNKAMTRMLLDEGAPVFRIEGGRGRIPIELALRGEASDMLAVFVEHAGSIDDLVDNSLADGRLSLVMTALARGALPTPLHEDLLLAALEPVGCTSWPRHSPFTCIQWPWSEAHNWAEPSADFISKMEHATVSFPSSPAKMRELVVGDYTAEEAWLNTMVNLVKSRNNKFSNRWLALTPDELWINPMPLRPSMKGPQQPFAGTLVELCAMHGHLAGLKLGLDAISRLGANAWIESNRDQLFIAACGARNAGAYPSLSAIRMLDRRIGKLELGTDIRKTITESLVANDYEPGLRAKAIGLFLQGPETLPSTEDLLNIFQWNIKASKSVAGILMAMAGHGLDLQRDFHGDMSILGLLMQSHPEAAATISSSMMSSTPTSAQETRSILRM